MTTLSYLGLLVMFVVTILGLGLPAARRLVSDPLEQVCAAAVVGLVACFVLGLLIYWLNLPFGCFLAAPGLALAGLIGCRATVREFWRAPPVRAPLLFWLAVACWTQALTAIIASYNGGAWGGDWLEHHQRALFFREHWPLDFNFFGNYLLPARPPLANVVTAGFQGLAGPFFATDQAVLALWSSLAFLPLVLLGRLAGGLARPGFLALLLALNPSFLQNSTFAWTKLPTAFFVLAGAYFLLTTLARPAAGPGRFALAALALAAALLTHYSAGPFCLVLSGWWLLWRLRRREFGLLRREAATGCLVVPPLLALWFGWSLWRYGAGPTLLSNSTALAFGPSDAFAQLSKIAGNVWATLVPHPFRDVDPALIAYGDPAERLRNTFFMISQVNRFGLLGTGGAVALAVVAWRGRRAWRQAGGPWTAAWSLPAAGLLVVLGVAVHGAPDEWGLAHICLQPLTLAGLAILAVRVRDLGTTLVVLLGCALAWDAAVGVGLHYGLQARAPDPAWLGSRDLAALLQFEGPAAFNAGLKQITGVRFLRDCLPSHVAPALVLLALLAATVAWRLSPDRRERDLQP